MSDMSRSRMATASSGDIRWACFRRWSSNAGRTGLAIRCESVDDCLAALPAALGIAVGWRCDVIGVRGGQFRQATLS